jgi:subtilisin family serine protease
MGLAGLAALATAKEPRQREDAQRHVMLDIDDSQLTSVDTGMPGQFGEPERAPADDPESKALRATEGPRSWLVYMDPALAKDSPERASVKAFAAQRGGIVKYEYDAVLPHVMNLRKLTAADVAQIRQLPGVVSVEPDEFHENVLQMHDSMPLIRALQSQITGAGLSARGAGVRVCVIDTGIDSDHLLYSSRIDTAAGRDFHNGDNNPEDDHGHGAHVSGTAVGGDGFTVNFGSCGVEPFQGVAVDATLIGVKVLNSSGGGSDSNIIAGINYCGDQSPTGGRADVINMSIGTGQFTSACTHSWAVAANNAVANGVVAVAAAGNNGFSNALSSPACGANVIAVGAVYDTDFPNCQDPDTSFTWCLNGFCTSTCTDSPVIEDDQVCFSNRSSMLDVSAPGCEIWSAGIAAGGTSIAAMCGTSQASPHVAGLAALILGEDPTLTPAEVHQIMRDGAVDLGTAGFDSTYGFGRIDVVNSLELLAAPCNNNGECDDGLFCNGAETCVASSCQAGTPPNCSDGVACTNDSCNEATNSCDHVANNANCDDGLFCNGSETCHPTLGCQAGTDPCAPQPCNEGTNTCGSGPDAWIVFETSTTVPGLGTAQDEDIVSYDMSAGTWSWVFDGSDVGLSGLVIDGMDVLPNGDILLSFAAAGSVPGLIGGPSGTSVDESDIVRFTPTALGATTSGTFNFHFDASDVGLTTNNENVDAIARDSSGNLVLSTVGGFSVTGATGDDEDLVRFTATSLGSVTSGSFTMLFDGSDVGLTANDEDIDSAGFTSSGSIILSTLGNFSVTGASGADEDLFEFVPTQLGSTTSGTFSLFLDLSAAGISTAEDIRAVHLVE